MTWWQKRGRKYSTLPTISNLGAFGVIWRIWWTHLQKRSIDGTDSIRRGGMNGLVLVLLLLAWWGRRDMSAEWKKGVADVQATLVALGEQAPASVAVYAMSGKRPASTPLLQMPSAKRYVIFPLRLLLLLTGISRQGTMGSIEKCWSARNSHTMITTITTITTGHGVIDEV
jgi:hypothetical protein